MVEEGHIMADHVHMLLKASRPSWPWPAWSATSRAKSAIHVARHLLDIKRRFAGQHFWARGYLVDTVGRDTETIRQLHPASKRRKTSGSTQLELPINATEPVNVTEPLKNLN